MATRFINSIQIMASNGVSTVPYLNFCKLLFILYSLQFNPHGDGDFIAIHEIDLDGNTKLISRLSGPDAGPKLQFVDSNWEKKAISSLSNKMIVEFKSDDLYEYTGFSLSIQFIPFQNDMCKSCLDMEQKTLKSPNYPKSYGNNVTCNWIITAQHGLHIKLELQEFNVNYFVLIAKNLLANTSHCHRKIYLGHIYFICNWGLKMHFFNQQYPL